MPKKMTSRETERHDVQGHQVEIRRDGEVEELWIDGVRHRFFITAQGYVLQMDAYVPAQSTLLEAVRDHFSRAAERGRSS